MSDEIPNTDVEETHSMHALGQALLTLGVCLRSTAVAGARAGRSQAAGVSLSRPGTWKPELEADRSSVGAQPTS